MSNGAPLSNRSNGISLTHTHTHTHTHTPPALDSKVVKMENDTVR